MKNRELQEAANLVLRPELGTLKNQLEQSLQDRRASHGRLVAVAALHGSGGGPSLHRGQKSA